MAGVSRVLLGWFASSYVRAALWSAAAGLLVGGLAGSLTLGLVVGLASAMVFGIVLAGSRVLAASRIDGESDRHDD